MKRHTASLLLLCSLLLLGGCSTSTPTIATGPRPFDPCRGNFSAQEALDQATNLFGLQRIMRQYNGKQERWFYVGSDPSHHYFLMVDFGTPLTLVDPATGERRSLGPLSVSVAISRDEAGIRQAFALTDECGVWLEFKTLEDLGIRTPRNGFRK